MAFQGECKKFPMQHLHHAFAKGHIKGHVLIEISSNGTIETLSSAVDNFQDIVVLKTNDASIVEMKKWLSDDKGAYDSTHASSYVSELEGKSDKSEVKEQKLKKAIKHLLKCNFAKNNLTDPVVLQPADCLVTSEILEYISKNIKEYVKNLEKLLGLVQPGGNILLLGMINATYMVVGNDNMHLLKMTEDDIRNSFQNAGLIIDVCEVQKREACVSQDFSDYESVIFVEAHKRK